GAYRRVSRRCSDVRAAIGERESPQIVGLLDFGGRTGDYAPKKKSANETASADGWPRQQPFSPSAAPPRRGRIFPTFTRTFGALSNGLFHHRYLLRLRTQATNTPRSTPTASSRRLTIRTANSVFIAAPILCRPQRRAREPRRSSHRSSG